MMHVIFIIMINFNKDSKIESILIIRLVEEFRILKNDSKSELRQLALTG